MVDGNITAKPVPHLDECLPAPLTEREQHLVKILELIQIEKFVPVPPGMVRSAYQRARSDCPGICGQGSFPVSVHQFLEKRITSTPNLRVICGFTRRKEVPSESTFSRAFAEYTKVGLGIMIHDALVKEHLSTELIGHVSRDATAIVGREKPAKKEKPPKKPKKKGRPAKGEHRGTARTEAA